MRSIVFAIALLMCWGVSCIAQDLSPVNGVYLSKRDDTQFLTLRQDSTFVLKQRKSPPDKNDPFVEYTGKYQLDGENIKLILDDGGTAQGKVQTMVALVLRLSVVEIVVYGLRQVSFREKMKDYLRLFAGYRFKVEGGKRRCIDDLLEVFR